MITKRTFFIALTVALNLLAFPIPGGFRLFVLFATAAFLLPIAIGSFVLWICHPTTRQGLRDLDYAAIAPSSGWASPGFGSFSGGNGDCLAASVILSGEG